MMNTKPESNVCFSWCYRSQFLHHSSVQGLLDILELLFLELLRIQTGLAHRFTRPTGTSETYSKSQPSWFDLKLL